MGCLFCYFILLLSAIENPTGLAIDWISGNMFISSSGTVQNQIIACNLEGEFVTKILVKDLFEVKSLALDPLRGHLYWSDVQSEKHVIEMANMDGSGRKVLASQQGYDSILAPQSR
jgi:Low-density lipoprotein receptor repeat class B